MKYKALKDVCQITMGQSPESTSYNDTKEGIPFFQGNADFGEKYPTERVWCNEPKKIAQPEDILISVRAPIGALNYAKSECCIGRGLAAITVPDMATRNYIFHLLKAKNIELNRKGTGSTFKAISKSVLEEVQVPIISENEQQKIVKIMDLLEDIIRKRKDELRSLDKLIRARFVEMFGDPVENEMEWKTSSLNSLCDGIGDGLHGTPEYDDNGGYPFINGNNLIDGKIIVTDTTKHIGQSEYERLYIPISTNAILISINGTLGKLAFYNGEKISLGKSACYCNLKSSVNKLFVYSLMKSNAFIGFLEKSATKSTIKNVGLKALREYKVILPPMKLQNQFADFVQQADKSKVAIQKSLDEVQLLFDSLMQKYFG